MQIPAPSNKLILAVAVLPVLAANLCYIIASQAGFLPVCIVYIEGCTSISATGRYGVSYWLFKALMLPQAVLLIVFWRSLRIRFSLSDGRSSQRMYVAGLVAAVFLVLYLVFLGTTGDFYRLMRRYGVFVFFLGTLVAQVLATRLLARSDDDVQAAVITQRILLLLMGILALAEMLLGTFGLQDDVAENIIEWNFSLLMQCWFLTWLLIGNNRETALPDGNR